MIYFSHLLNDEDMKEVIKNTRMGVESIEFSIAENLDHLTDTLRSYEKRLENMECEKLILHGPFLDLNPMAYDSLVVEATRKRYEQAYEAAKALHASRIIFHSGYVPSVYFLMGWAERMADFYNRFLDDKDDSIEIMMENVLDPYPAPLKEVAEKVSHPAFGLCMDVGHANCYSEISCKEWAETLAPYLRHLHIHDNLGDRDSHLAVGKGNIPFKDIFSALESQKQEISCTIECNSKEDAIESFHQLSPFQNIVSI